MSCSVKKAPAVFWATLIMLIRINIFEYIHNLIFIYSKVHHNLEIFVISRNGNILKECESKLLGQLIRGTWLIYIRVFCTEASHWAAKLENIPENTINWRMFSSDFPFLIYSHPFVSLGRWRPTITRLFSIPSRLLLEDSCTCQCQSRLRWQLYEQKEGFW